MEPFRLVCRDGRGEWYIYETEAESALAAFEQTTTRLRSPYVVIPAPLQGTKENLIVQRWKQGASELNDCLNCGYDVRSLMRASDGLAICPECGVGAVMKPVGSPPVLTSIEFAPGFKPGLMLDRWGVAVGVLGFFDFPVAIVGILMGVFAHEFSRGVRGTSAIRTGVAALIINVLIVVAKATGYWP